MLVNIEPPAGWELTGEFRYAKVGESFIGVRGEAETAYSIHGNIRPCPILRKAWVAPSWLPKGCWLFKSSHQVWYLTNKEPSPSHCGRYAVCAEDTISPIPIKDLLKCHGLGGWTEPPSDEIVVEIK